jgi:hypothetical protein
MILDPAMRRAADHAVNLIALAQQQPRQISAILTRNSRRQQAFSHKTHATQRSMLSAYGKDTKDRNLIDSTFTDGPVGCRERRVKNIERSHPTKFA